MTFNDFSDELKEVLIKMCSYVPVDPQDIDWKDELDPHYRKYTFTKEQEEDFKQWLIERLKSRKFARAFGTMTDKTSRELAASYFVAFYGFKVTGDTHV